jgi:copper chaperone NosL
MLFKALSFYFSHQIRAAIGKLLVVGLILIAAVLLITACSSESDLEQPPDIRYGEDVCDRCMMIINEARYATALVTSAGETRRFDDIGGMLRYDKEMEEEVAVYWVHDYETEEWLKADNAYFVTDTGLHTPMGFGIIAFTTLERAESWAENEGGMVMEFSALLSASANEEDF